jgi:hypothetical protein
MADEGNENGRSTRDRSDQQQEAPDKTKASVATSDNETSANEPEQSAENRLPTEDLERRVLGAVRQAVTDVLKEGNQPAELPEIDMDFVASPTTGRDSLDRDDAVSREPTYSPAAPTPKAKSNQQSDLAAPPLQPKSNQTMIIAGVGAGLCIAVVAALVALNSNLTSSVETRRASASSLPGAGSVDRAKPVLKKASKADQQKADIVPPKSGAAPKSKPDRQAVAVVAPSRPEKQSGSDSKTGDARVAHLRETKEQAQREAAEKQRLAAEASERKRLAEQRAAEEKALREAAEKQRLAAEAAERKRLAEQRAAEEEAQRKAAEKQRLAAEAGERKRLSEQRAAEEKAKREAAEKQRLAAEAAERKRLAEQRAAEEKAKREAAEKQHLAAEAAERKRLTEQRAAEEEAQREAAERQRLAEEAAERKRLAEQRAAEEEAKREAAEKQRLVAEAAERKRLAGQRAAAEKWRQATEAAERQRLARLQRETEVSNTREIEELAVTSKKRLRIESQLVDRLFSVLKDKTDARDERDVSRREPRGASKGLADNWAVEEKVRLRLQDFLIEENKAARTNNVPRPRLAVRPGRKMITLRLKESNLEIVGELKDYADQHYIVVLPSKKKVRLPAVHFNCFGSHCPDSVN